MKYLLLGFLLLGFYMLSFSSCKNREKEIFPLSDAWESPIEHQKIPKGIESISAKECGVCHVDHYQEWQTSTHALAWSDEQFQAELKKESSPFFCINCHIPLENQQEYLINGKLENDIYQPLKEPNPHFDKDLQSEAITCAVCHIRDGAIIAMNSNTDAPHKTVKDKDFLSEKLCISCHNANATLNELLVCTFETGDEWKSGPYFGQKNCVSCHMDTISRILVPNYPLRKSHFHNFPGSGIPKEKGLKPGMLNGLSINIENVVEEYIVGQNFKPIVKLQNENAGHRVPTGDPERFFLIESILFNQKMDTIVQMKKRIGEIWEWWPKVKKLSDNNFAIGEERSYLLNHQFEHSGTYKWIYKLTKHRMDHKSADYNKLGDNYPLSILVKQDTFDINVKK